MKVTGNGDFCQVFLVLLSDWDSQAEACPLPSSLGTRAVIPACLSTWLLSLGAVPIPLICLLFSCEGLCCNRRKGGGVCVWGGGENILPCFIDNISRDLDDVLIWTRHKYIWRELGNMCSLQQILVKILQCWCNTKPFILLGQDLEASGFVRCPDCSTGWVALCQEQNLRGH